MRSVAAAAVERAARKSIIVSEPFTSLLLPS
jgi:hypothetical protein